MAEMLNADELEAFLKKIGIYDQVMEEYERAEQAAEFARKDFYSGFKAGYKSVRGIIPHPVKIEEAYTEYMNEQFVQKADDVVITGYSEVE